jgi:hypothetical protein
MICPHYKILSMYIKGNVFENMVIMDYQWKFKKKNPLDNLNYFFMSASVIDSTSFKCLYKEPKQVTLQQQFSTVVFKKC